MGRIDESDSEEWVTPGCQILSGSPHSGELKYKRWATSGGVQSKGWPTAGNNSKRWATAGNNSKGWATAGNNSKGWATTGNNSKGWATAGRLIPWGGLTCKEKYMVLRRFVYLQT